MATAPIYAGGGRRGAAPRVAQRAAAGTAALGYDEELMRQLLGSFAQQQAAGDTTAAPGELAIADTGGFMPTLSEALGSGTNVASFSAPNYGGIDIASLLGASGGGGGGGGASGSNFSLSTLASLLGSAGVLAENRPLQEIAGDIGTASAGLGTLEALSRGDMTGAAVSGAPLAARALGVPMSAVNLGLSAATGNVPGMINSGISLASPLAGAGNALLSSVTSPALGGDQAVSIGDILTQYGFGRDVFGDVGPIDATQGAKIINALNSQDRLGALMALRGGDNTQLPTGAATGAANALSAAENINSMDALMRITNAFGTVATPEESNAQIQNEQLKTIASELAVEQSRMDTEARVAAEFAAAQQAALQAAQAKAAAAGVKLPADFGLPATGPQFEMPTFTAPTQGQGLDFSVDMEAINRQLAEQSKWASDYLASQTAGLENAYNSLISSLQAEQSAWQAVGGQPTQNVGIDVSFPSYPDTPTYNETVTVPSYTTPDYSVPSWQPSSPVYDYQAPAQLPSYQSPTYDFGAPSSGYSGYAW